LDLVGTKTTYFGATIAYPRLESHIVEEQCHQVVKGIMESPQPWRSNLGDKCCNTRGILVAILKF